MRGKRKRKKKDGAAAERDPRGLSVGDFRRASGTWIGGRHPVNRPPGSIHFVRDSLRQREIVTKALVTVNAMVYCSGIVTEIEK